MNVHYKINYIKSFLLLFILYIGVFSYSQNSKVDSLKAVLQKLKEDTTKVNTLNEIANSVYRSAPYEAIEYSSEAKTLAENINFKKGLAEAYKIIGLGYYMQGNYVEAVKNWEPALEIFKILGDEKGIANIISNRGSIYYTTGKNVLATESYLEALKMAEKLDDKRRIATLLMNLGLIYSEQPATLDTALNYYFRSLRIGESIEYINLIGLNLINVGEIYFKKEAYDSALVYFEKSLTILTSSNDISASLNNIGRIYAEKEDYPTAIKYFQDALEMALKEDSKLETARCLLSLASTYKKQGLPLLAIDYYSQAKTIAEEIELKYELSDAYQGLAFTYEEILDFQNAYKYLSLQNDVNNVIYKIEDEKNTDNLMSVYQLEKKQVEIEILEQKSVIEQMNSRKQKAIIITVGAVGILLLLLAIGFYNRFLFIRKTSVMINAQKNEIESQRDEIEAQRDQMQAQRDTVVSQKELITDSISYAERIQSAMLPSPALIDELIPKNFVFFRPKDIVSGDFYWVKEVQDHLVIVGADCTGHGVPGGFMSMLGITLLNDLINDRCFNAPSAILEQLRLKIKGLLVQEGNSEEAKDGMDLAMVILNKNTREMHFSGANNPLYIIRNKELPAGKQLEPYLSLGTDNYQLFEIKGDKQPIGIHWEETKFTTHSIYLQEQDTFYLFSDGYIDQFGGENRKKFKSRSFKNLLLSIQEDTMEKQGQILENTFDTWRGDHEQLDDICVLGFRI